jgi:hypothetical protein
MILADVQPMSRIYTGFTKVLRTPMLRPPAGVTATDHRRNHSMGSISVTFTGSTMEEVAGLVAAWRPPVTRRSDGTHRSAVAAVPPADGAAAIGRVLSGVNGVKSRRLLSLLAEAGTKGEVVTLSGSLVRDFGVSGGTAFAGMIGPVNRRAVAVLGRPLIDNAASDPNARAWRIGPEDARAVLDALSPISRRNAAGMASSASGTVREPSPV